MLVNCGSAYSMGVTGDPSTQINLSEQLVDSTNQQSNTVTEFNGYKYENYSDEHINRCIVYKDGEIVEISIYEKNGTHAGQLTVLEANPTQSSDSVSVNGVDYKSKIDDAVRGAFGSPYTGKVLSVGMSQGYNVMIKENYYVGQSQDYDYVLLGKMSIAAISTYTGITVVSLLSILSTCSTLDDFRITFSSPFAIKLRQGSRYWDQFAYLNGETYNRSGKTHVLKIITGDFGGVVFDTINEHQHYDFNNIETQKQRAISNYKQINTPPPTPTPTPTPPPKPTPPPSNPPPGTPGMTIDLFVEPEL